MKHTLVTLLLLLGLGSAIPAQQRSQPAATAQSDKAEDFKDLPALMAALPNVSAKPVDNEVSLQFSALPLACIDDLQSKPQARAYFWQPTYRTVDGYDKSRAFYGCNDWATAVSATWTMVSLLKRFPELGSGNLVREKLTDHLGRSNLEGEMAYFKAAANFQRPYGYAWFLKLYADLATWKDPDGSRYAENATPLARYFLDALPGYLIGLERPNKMAGQTNTALTLSLLLDYVDATRDMTLKRAVAQTAQRFYMTDTNCATETEAATPEMISPCLSEASVMSRVLEQAEFVTWLNTFLPPANSTKFKPLRSIAFDAVSPTRRGGNRGPQRGGDETAAAADLQAGGRGGATPNPRALWIGLAFTRADAYSHLASALPASDPRVAVFRRLASFHASEGQRELSDPAAFDAPWVGALAFSYLTSSGAGK